MRRALGYLLMFIAFLGILGERLIGEAGLDLVPATLLRIVVGIAVVAVGLGGRNLALKGRKERAVLEGEARSSDPRAPVLYLRSFNSDRATADAHLVDGFIQLTTEEEQFARVLEGIGPVVAIGDPREKLPTLGADRVYVGEGWQRNVLDLLGRARLVVLRLSPTQGVQWELQQVVAQVDPERFLLFLPLGYKHPALKAMADPWLPKPLPPPLRRRTKIGTLQGIVRFEKDWTPKFIPARFAFLHMSLRTPIRPHLKFMLRPVFEQVGAAWTKPPIGVFSVLLILLYLTGAWTFLRVWLR